MARCAKCHEHVVVASWNQFLSDGDFAAHERRTQRDVCFCDVVDEDDEDD